MQNGSADVAQQTPQTSLVLRTRDRNNYRGPDKTIAQQQRQSGAEQVLRHKVAAVSLRLGKSRAIVRTRSKVQFRSRSDCRSKDALCRLSVSLVNLSHWLLRVRIFSHTHTHKLCGNLTRCAQIAMLSLSILLCIMHIYSTRVCPLPAARSKIRAYTPTLSAHSRSRYTVTRKSPITDAK